MIAPRSGIAIVPCIDMSCTFCAACADTIVGMGIRHFLRELETVI